MYPSAARYYSGAARYYSIGRHLAHGHGLMLSKAQWMHVPTMDM